MRTRPRNGAPNQKQPVAAVLLLPRVDRVNKCCAARAGARNLEDGAFLFGYQKMGQLRRLGMKTPRWPECHIPDWAKSLDKTQQQEKVLKMLEKIVSRYKDSQTIKYWQVENEPFLSIFGICPKLDPYFLTSEVALVKDLDPTRKVIVTDSGELSLWYQAAREGDIFGTTLYRDIYQKRFGYVTYPIGPNFFKMKELWTRTLTDQEHFIVIELQAEPWANGWVKNVPLEEQFITMNEKKLVENVTYARRVGFEEIYLWGVEWWYWLKVEKDYTALWDTGKDLFQQYGGR